MRMLKSVAGIFILLFVAFGAVLGVLFAPAKGPSIRKEISNQRNFYTNVLSEKFKEFVNKIFTHFDNDKKESTQFAENESVKSNQVELKNTTAS